jgi:transcriptional regulator with XRE-family HTH domain
MAERLRAARTKAGLSLDALAHRAGVSRSMLSAIERQDRMPTVLVLDRIATALGTTITRLLAPEQSEQVIVMRHDAQPVAVDPGGWERRILSPVLPGVDFEFMRTTLGPGVDAGSFSPHVAGSREYIAVEHGRLALTLAKRAIGLEEGDSICFAADVWHALANASKTERCVYYLVREVRVPHREEHRDPGEKGSRRRTHD